MTPIVDKVLLTAAAVTNLQWGVLETGLELWTVPLMICGRVGGGLKGEMCREPVMIRKIEGGK